MIVYRAMITPDGTILQSKHRHDFVGHDDKNGNFYAIDGGLTYCRITANVPDFRILEVYDTDNFEIVRQFAYRYSAGGKMTPIAKMSDCHLNMAVIYAKEHNQPYHLLEKEQKFRNHWKINVNEQGELH